MKKIIALLCVMMVFATPYRIMGFPMPECIGCIAVLLQILQHARYKIPAYYGVFAVYMLIVPATLSFLLGIPGDYSLSFFPKGLILTSMFIIILLPSLDYRYVLKYYKYLTYIAIIFFLIQEICYHSLGFRPAAFIPFLESYYDGGMSAQIFRVSSIDRSSSFFLEPAHFVQFVIPYFAIVAVDCLKKRKITLEIIFLLFVIVAIRSGCGYVLSLAIVVFSLFTHSLPKAVKISLCSIVCIGVGIVCFYQNQFVSDILNRTSELSMDVESSGPQSGFLRIWRGYFIYDALDPISKIFGIGVGSLNYANSLIYVPGVLYEGDYMNGIQSLLCSGGIIGTLLFFLFVFQMFRTSTIYGKCILVTMLVLFFIENMLFTSKMFMYILIAYSINIVKETQGIK